MKCRKCDKETGPAFGLCSDCIRREDYNYCPSCGADTANPCGCVDEVKTLSTADLFTRAVEKFPV